MGQSNFLSPESAVIGLSSANNLVDFQNGLDLAGAERTIFVNHNPPPRRTRPISGIISNGSLTKGHWRSEPTAREHLHRTTTVTNGVLAQRRRYLRRQRSCSPMAGCSKDWEPSRLADAWDGAGQVAIGGGGGFSAFGGG